jgi:hypothetical protein
MVDAIDMAGSRISMRGACDARLTANLLVFTQGWNKGRT